MGHEDSRRSNRGQWFAAGGLIISLGVALVLALIGHGDVAKVLVGSTLAVVVAVFVTGRVWGGRGGDGDPSG